MPPVGSQTERIMITSEVHDILLAEGAQQLKIQWPKVPWAAPEQPLFVAPMTPEYSDPYDPFIQVSLRFFLMPSQPGSKFLL